jgi:calcium-translocating P-type ATPase
MMITVVLSANMRRMMKDNVLVRKLVGVETSGSLNILFTDKTGTLTQGKLAVTAFITCTGKVVDAKRLIKTGLYKDVALNCGCNNSSQYVKKTAVGGNSTDRALMEFVGGGIDTSRQKGLVMPFDSAKKYSFTEIIDNDKKLVLVKGAPEVLLPACINALGENGGVGSFDAAAVKRAMVEQAEGRSRLLALCQCSNITDARSLKNFTLVGLLCIKDEIRKEARAAVREVVGAGIQVVMVTGDNRVTAESVARASGLLGLKNPDELVLTSSELNVLSDDEVKKILPSLRVVARALPSDKSRLVRISQEIGLVAGMTGDGVNDAPALKKADVGFAMGSGTEIAKEAGDIIILDNNIASIAKAILYGRTIFKSIRKFLIFQLSINLCAVLVSIIGPFIGFETPVTVIQMLWINMIMDTLAGLAYAGEPPLPEYMKEPPKKRRAQIINRYMASQIAWSGVYTTILCILFFKLPFFNVFFRGEQRYLLTGFFALFIFAGVFNSLSARTYRLNLLAHIVKNKVFLLVMAMVSVIQISLIYFGGRVFRTTGLTVPELTLILCLASTVIIADLARKIVLRANNRKGFI